jgi:hypothetical protein
MTAEYFDATLLLLHSRRPFQVYTVVLNNGQRLEIDSPLALSARDGRGIFFAPTYVPVYFDHESVLEIIDAPASVELNPPASP